MQETAEPIENASWVQEVRDIRQIEDTDKLIAELVTFFRNKGHAVSAITHPHNIQLASLVHRLTVYSGKAHAMGHSIFPERRGERTEKEEQILEHAVA